GGRALRALLGLRMDYVVATRIAASIGQAMAILFGLLALLVFNPFLFFIAIFVFLGAQAEAQMAESTSAIRGLRVHDGMMTHYLTLSGDDDLAHAVEQLLAGSQQDFPVVNDNNEVVGLLTRNRLVRTLSEKGSEIRVGEVMRKTVKTVEEDEDLEEVHQALRTEESPTLPVLRHGRLVGLLTMENIGEMVMINSALRYRGKPGEAEKILEHR
ncbi:MAG: CBS domain-containing protein, partial [Opitutales bacterium]